MAKTRNDLIEFIAQQLGILAAGQYLAQEDRDVIAMRLDPANDLLGQKAIAYLQDLDDIDDAWFMPFGNYAAGQCARAFGLTGQSLADVLALAQQAQTDLYDLARARNTRQVLSMDSWSRNGMYGWRW